MLSSPRSTPSRRHLVAPQVDLTGLEASQALAFFISVGESLISGLRTVHHDDGALVRSAVCLNNLGVATMPNLTKSNDLHREVAATFGRRKTQSDPDWEHEFGSWLKVSRTRDELIGLFDTHRSAENPFDTLMDHVLIHALCKREVVALQQAL